MRQSANDTAHETTKRYQVQFPQLSAYRALYTVAQEFCANVEASDGGRTHALTQHARVGIPLAASQNLLYRACTKLALPLSSRPMNRHAARREI